MKEKTKREEMKGRMKRENEERDETRLIFSKKKMKKCFKTLKPAR